MCCFVIEKVKEKWGRIFRTLVRKLGASGNYGTGMIKKKIWTILFFYVKFCRAIATRALVLRYRRRWCAFFFFFVLSLYSFWLFYFTVLSFIFPHQGSLILRIIAGKSFICRVFLLFSIWSGIMLLILKKCLNDCLMWEDIWGIEWEMLPLYRPEEDKGEQWRKVTPLVNPKRKKYIEYVVVSVIRYVTK